MVVPRILSLFAGLMTAIDVAAFTTGIGPVIPESTLITSDRGFTNTLSPSTWTDLTTLNSTTITSTAITQNTQVQPSQDPGQTNPSASLDSPATASDPSSSPSSSLSVLSAGPGPTVPCSAISRSTESSSTTSDLPTSSPAASSSSEPGFAAPSSTAPSSTTSDSTEPGLLATTSTASGLPAPSSTTSGSSESGSPAPSSTIPGSPTPSSTTVGSTEPGLPALSSTVLGLTVLSSTTSGSSGLGLPAPNSTAPGLPAPSSTTSSSSELSLPAPGPVASNSSEPGFAAPSSTVPVFVAPSSTPPGLAGPGSTIPGSIEPGLAPPSSTSGTSTAIISTITSIPQGLTAITLPGTSYTANDWITTTNGNHQTTLLPLIAAGGGHGIVFWGFPPFPNVEIAFPGFPKFHFPCIKILFISIGSCTSPPVTDGPAIDNSSDNPPAGSPTDPVPSPTTTSSNSESSSSCTATEPVPSCIQTCSTVVQTGGVTATSCATPTCTSIQSCSATATTSTVFGTSTPIVACYYGGSASQDATSISLDAGPTSCPLAKRTVLLPENFENNNIDRFLKAELIDAAKNGNLLELRGQGVPIYGAMSSSKRFQFLDMPFRTGATRQLGCTTVYIFSKQGMWEAHFWEIPAFVVPSLMIDNMIIETQPSMDIDFVNKVLDFMRNGDGPAYPGILQDTNPGGLFAANLLGILVVTPKQDPDGPPQVLRFQLRVNQIKTQIRQILSLDNSFPINTVGYRALIDGDPRKLFRDGTVLIQYDPHQSPPGAAQTTALVRIYVDGNVLPDITWGPLPNQIPGQVAQRDLEERDSDCSVSQQSPPPTTLLTSTITGTESPRIVQPPPAATSSVLSAYGAGTSDNGGDGLMPFSSHVTSTIPPAHPPAALSSAPSVGVTPNAQCAGTGNPVTFGQPLANNAIMQFCNNPKNRNHLIVAPINIGNGKTKDGREKVFGVSSGTKIDNDNTLWMGVNHTADSCEGTFVWPPSTNDQDQINICVDRFQRILNGCDTDTITAKRGGTLSENCTLYSLVAAPNNKGEILRPDPNFGSFHCEDTQLASQLTANTCSCWFDKYPDQKDLFDKPSGGCASLTTPPPYDNDGV